MKPDYLNHLSTLRRLGWIATLSAEKGTIPEEILDRYDWIPEAVWHFITGTERVASNDETTWFLSWKDYTGTSEYAYAWNEWEILSLRGAKEMADPSWEASTIAFWNEHFPIMLTVQPHGYGYAAIRRSDGAVVAGWEPEFEEPFGVIAESFDELLSLLPEMDPERNLDSLLPDD